MFKPLQSLFVSSPHKASVQDVKYFIQEWLKSELKSERVLCEAVEGDRVHIRVGSPTLKQEMLLAQSDLEEALLHELAYQVRSWRVRIG
jgi:hypothetical protein